MNKVFTLFCFFLLCSCNGLIPKDQYELTYIFQDKDNVSKNKINATVEVIKKRLRQYHKNVDVRSDSNNDIKVLLNDGFILESVNQVVENRGKLDFWPCLQKEDMVGFLMKMDSVSKIDSSTRPLSEMLQGLNHSGFPVFLEKDRLEIETLINQKNIQLLFIDEFNDIGLLFGLPNDGFFEVYGVVTNQKERAPVNETHILEARQDYDQIGRPSISLQMNDYGGDQWYKMTDDAFKNQTQIAISLNDIVYSAPSVSNGPISGGLTQIAGSFTLEQAIDLSNVLSSQQIIPQLKFVSSEKLAKQD
jgi:SecD/SecF fusion protein